MRRYVVLRMLSLLPTLLGVTVAVFLLVRLIPGTIVDQMIGTEGSYSPETVKALRAFFALDVPLHVQYGRWLGGVIQGDLGTKRGPDLPRNGALDEHLSGSRHHAGRVRLQPAGRRPPHCSRPQASWTLGREANSSIPHNGEHFWVV